jgi:hypothetical protein
MSRTRRIHWGLVLLAGLLAELGIFAIFLVLLTVATLAGAPELARPMSTLDYIDAMVSSFLSPAVSPAAWLRRSAWPVVHSWRREDTGSRAAVPTSRGHLACDWCWVVALTSAPPALRQSDQSEPGARAQARALSS